jgi:hypothetical protein
MKITECVVVESVIIETDRDEFGTFRRHSADNWEVLMGESWEPEYFPETIESLYQQYILI